MRLSLKVPRGGKGIVSASSMWPAKPNGNAVPTSDGFPLQGDTARSEFRVRTVADVEVQPELDTPGSKDA